MTPVHLSPTAALRWPRLASARTRCDALNRSVVSALDWVIGLPCATVSVCNSIFTFRSRYLSLKSTSAFSSSSPQHIGDPALGFRQFALSRTCPVYCSKSASRILSLQ